MTLQREGAVVSVCREGSRGSATKILGTRPRRAPQAALKQQAQPLPNTRARCMRAQPGNEVSSLINQKLLAA